MRKLKTLLSTLAAVLVTATLAYSFTMSVDRIIGAGSAPALTSCGGGSPAITGSDLAGTVTMGTSATGCVITFAVAKTTAPHCIVQWIATPLASQSYTTSGTAITLTQTATSSNVAKYICIDAAGG